MNMKLILVLTACFFFRTADAQIKYEIKGQVENFKPANKIVLQYRSDTGRVDQPGKISKDGSFEIRGAISQPVKATLIYMYKKESNKEGGMSINIMERKDFYIDKGTTLINGPELKDAIVKGGTTQKEYELLQEQLEGSRSKMKPLQDNLREYNKNKDKASADETVAKIREIRKEMDEIESQFVRQHPDSYVSFDVVKGRSVIINSGTLEPVFNLLSNRLKNSNEGKAIAERLDIAKRTAIGRPAMDFAQENVDGKMTSLSSLKGKYVLIDFWASWCGPCRAENPNLIKAYNEFKDKNFEVLGVSLDEDKNAWLKAIKDDKLPWLQISDLKGLNNSAALLYGVKAIPQNFLIDPNGKIIGSNLRGDRLSQKLSEILN